MSRYEIQEHEIDGRPSWRLRDNDTGELTMGSYGSYRDAKYALDYAFTDRPDPYARIAELEAALRRALSIIDSPAYRDSTGLRPNAHPAVDDLRELLAS